MGPCPTRWPMRSWRRRIWTDSPLSSDIPTSLLQENRNFRSFPDWVKVYNSGGWVVDTVERQQFHGGAVILIDENLETTSLRMYNESVDPNDYAVSVQEATHPGDPPGAFHKRIAGLSPRRQALEGFFRGGGPGR